MNHTIGSIVLQPVTNFHQLPPITQSTERYWALMAAVRGWDEAMTLYMDTTKQHTLADRIEAFKIWREAKEHLRSFLQ